MKYICLTLIALIYLKTGTMEPVEISHSLDRTKSWKDLANHQEPLSLESEKSESTNPDSSSIESELRELITQYTLDDTRVLHVVKPKSAIPNLQLATPTGTMFISAKEASVLNLQKPQATNGEVTLEHREYCTTAFLRIYTDFEIFSVDFELKDFLLTISGSDNKKYKMLLYRLTRDFTLEKLKCLDAQSQQVLAMQRHSFLLEYFKHYNQSTSVKIKRFFQRPFFSKPAPERK